ncbi:GNAT family N-acetyltransferase [Pantoea sp. FN0302]|uniref:GNAT family N-acetyltransferase n=1 Tax=unclassified Pantoea TaxID=2630326 RepID=UPI003CE95F1A
MSKIVVRHVEPQDAHALQQLYAQESSFRDTLQIPYPSLAMWQERIAHQQPGHYALVACMEERVVGNLTLEVNQSPRRRHSASFGLGVDANERGKGVAQALMRAMIDLCDNWLAVERIELTVYTDNDAALALYQKFGFVTEGTARDYALRAGERVDVHYMARLRKR